MFAFGGLSLIFSIALAVHAFRTGRHYAWAAAIMVLQPIAGLIYLFVELLPELMGTGRMQRAGAATLRTLDPGREYREAKAALAEVATVHNQARLAATAAALGRSEEAERLFREAARGVHADDPALLLGRANALLELDRPAEALEALTHLGASTVDERTPAATMALGRAYEALGHVAEAEAALRDAAETLPGFEGQARYAAFLARHGRRGEARELLSDMDQRLRKAPPHARREARPWRALAAKAINHRP